MATGFEQVELNYVVPQNFYMVIDLMPTVQYNLQQVTIPSLTGGEAELANRFNPGRTFIPGNTLDYGTLDVTFLIDKGFISYREILKWLKGINHPDTHETYKEWVDKGTDLSKSNNFKNTTSTVNLFCTDAAGRPLVEWTFYNAFPTSLAGPTFDATSVDAEYIQSDVSFRFTHFEHDIYTDSGRKINEKI